MITNLLKKEIQRQSHSHKQEANSNSFHALYSSFDFFSLFKWGERLNDNIIFIIIWYNGGYMSSGCLTCTQF